MKYLVMEIQSTPGGATSTPVTAYDSETEGGVNEALLAAKAKYYQILSSAAVSQVPIHSAAIITDTGFFVECEHFEHKVSP